ncbi:MAG TPA: isoprenylcysteine carboxylmethyltransferase family protein [Thermoanaerobaculia bacterium]|jgi:protein-S-isoprenylcysteine O-methyltransferase Ste14
MSRETLLLLCLNFAFIGALPRIFFRRGGLGWKWWTTALPLFASPVVAILMYAGILRSAVPQNIWSNLQLVAVVLDALSIALIALTIGTNRVPLALWHQKDDAPQNIVTFGAYRHVRHPFYVSFLIALTAAVLVAPHVLTIAILLYALFILNRTAAGEEKRLAASEFGDEYGRYMSRTGRFFPRWTRRDA